MLSSVMAIHIRSRGEAHRRLPSTERGSQQEIWGRAGHPRAGREAVNWEGRGSREAKLPPAGPLFSLRLPIMGARCCVLRGLPFLCNQRCLG